eukprot:EG_transcript_26409
MASAVPLLALLVLGCLHQSHVGALVTRGLVGPSEEAPLNDIGVNPDIAAFAPNGIDFLFINLNRSTLRRRHMEQQFRAARLPATRLPATVVSVDSMDVTLGLRGTRGYPRKKNNFTRRQYAATLGCRRSHTAAVAQLLAHGQPGTWHMVFEDDVVFPPTLFREAAYFMQQVPDDWDVVRFDCVGVPRSHPSYYNVIAPGVYRVHWGNGCVEKPKTKLRCWLCGGAFAVVYRHDSLPTVLRAIHQYV